MSAAAQSEMTGTAAQSARPSRAFSITSVIAGWIQYWPRATSGAVWESSLPE